MEEERGRVVLRPAFPWGAAVCMEQNHTARRSIRIICKFANLSSLERWEARGLHPARGFNVFRQHPHP